MEMPQFLVFYIIPFSVSVILALIRIISLRYTLAECVIGWGFIDALERIPFENVGGLSIHMHLGWFLICFGMLLIFAAAFILGTYSVIFWWCKVKGIDPKLFMWG